MEDASPQVRIAAAEALCRCSQAELQNGLRVLEDFLKHENDTLRIEAARSFESLGALAKGSAKALHVALEDRNKYVVRIVNRVLNQLEGTSREVR